MVIFTSPCSSLSSNCISLIAYETFHLAAKCTLTTVLCFGYLISTINRISLQTLLKWQRLKNTAALKERSACVNEGHLLLMHQLPIKHITRSRRRMELQLQDQFTNGDTRHLFLSHNSLRERFNGQPACIQYVPGQLVMATSYECIDFFVEVFQINKTRCTKHLKIQVKKNQIYKLWRSPDALSVIIGQSVMEIDKKDWFPNRSTLPITYHALVTAAPLNPPSINMHELKAPMGKK